MTRLPNARIDGDVRTEDPSGDARLMREEKARRLPRVAAMPWTFDARSPFDEEGEVADAG